MPARHRVLRVHGGRLVVGERRSELESELDAQAAEGYVLAQSFTVDDNVYLVMVRHAEPSGGVQGAGDQNSV